jgi:ribosomal protein S18 acetylase RimI-like enzyme
MTWMPTDSDRGGNADRAAGSAERVLRQATAADVPSVQRLVAAAYAKYAGRMDRPPAPVLADYHAAVRAGHVWVLGAPIIGVIVLTEDDGSLLIENVAVHPSAQGRGLGRALLEFAEQQAAARGLARLTLYTNEVMVENLEIYVSLGYRETGRRGESGYRRVFMEKPLDG